jgi:hypothetical protein
MNGANASALRGSGISLPWRPIAQQDTMFSFARPVKSMLQASFDQMQAEGPSLRCAWFCLPPTPPKTVASSPLPSVTMLRLGTSARLPFCNPARHYRFLPAPTHKLRIFLYWINPDRIATFSYSFCAAVLVSCVSQCTREAPFCFACS